MTKPLPGRSTTDREMANWDLAYKLDASTILWSEPPVPFLPRVLELLGPCAGGCIADLPCGDGRNSPPLAVSFPMLICADASKHALLLARLRLRRDHQTAVFLNCDIDWTPLLSNALAGVFCCDLLGHLRRPGVALAELRRITAPGGRVIGTAFSLGDPTRGVDMAAVGREEYLYRNAFYYRFRSEAEIESLLADTGMHRIACELVRWNEPAHEGFRPYPHSHESWLFCLEK